MPLAAPALSQTAFLLPIHALAGHCRAMMRRRIFLLFSMALATPASAQPSPLGIFGTWGAFRDDRRCYAIAEPERPDRDGARPFATVSWWPGRGVGGQLHFRLTRSKRAGSAVLLRIDDRTFQLRGGGADAWASDPGADAEIVSAMRTGIAMSVETRAASGAVLRDSYPLRGAATAIDAAAIACARLG